MKKLITFVLILALAASMLVSCNKQSEEASASSTAESSTAESSTVECIVIETTTPESSATEESGLENIVLDYEIPEFDIGKVLYCEKCTLQGHEENTGEGFGVLWLTHNCFEFRDNFAEYIFWGKDEEFGEKYIYAAFIPYQKIMENKLSREEMLEILKAFGFVESAEAVELMDGGTRATATAGYFPMASYNALKDYLIKAEYAVGISWLSEDCIANKECRYFDSRVG